MSTPIDKIGLPPPALGALRKAKVKTAEKAAAMTDKELLAIPRFGKGGLEILRAFEEAVRAAGPAPTLDSAISAVRARQASPPPHAGPTLSGRRAELAKMFFDRLADKAQGSQFATLVTNAWRLALLFEQEADRAQGGPLVLADGMEVLFNGQRCILRTKIEPGEKIPDDQRVGAAYLVKAS